MIASRAWSRVSLLTSLSNDSRTAHESSIRTHLAANGFTGRCNYSFTVSRMPKRLCFDCDKHLSRQSDESRPGTCSEESSSRTSQKYFFEWTAVP